MFVKLFYEYIFKRLNKMRLNFKYSAYYAGRFWFYYYLNKTFLSRVTAVAKPLIKIFFKYLLKFTS